MDHHDHEAGPLAGLLAVCAFMFVGAMASGALPYWINLRESHLSAASALGGGLLIGSALAVVIPEGFHAFAEAAAGGHDGHDHGLHDHDHDGPPHGLTGLALVGGFLAMLLLDQAQAAVGGGHHHHHHHGTAAAGAAAAVKGVPERRSPSPPAASAAPDRALTGLLVHCAADGLAMGAASLSGDAALSAVVGLAMVLHKAPMAFGLSTYLMSARWSWPRAQRALALFSAAAPAAALATRALLGSVPALTSPAAVALVLLFSGGTFLHAATMHILAEVLGSSGCGGHGGAMGRAQLLAVGAGCVLPALLSWGHAH